MKAFPIPHLENNAFLYGDLPASFQLPSTEAPKTQNPPKDSAQAHTKEPQQTATKAETALEDRVEADSQSTRCSSHSADEPKLTALPYERNLLAECKKLRANVNAMKRKHSLEDCKSRSSSPILAASKADSTPGQGKGHGGMTRFSLEDGFKSGKRTNSRRKETDEQETAPNLLIAACVPPLTIQSKGNKENSEAKKAVRRSLSRGERTTFSGVKPNVGYLKDVYSVIEQHARHCQDLKKDLRRLKSEFEENLSRVR